MSARAAIPAVLAALTLAAGCGGRSAQTPPQRLAEWRVHLKPALRRPSRPLLIAAIGDSITAGAPLWDPAPSVRAHMAEQLNPQSQYEYWARRRLGPRAHFRNCGVFGATTAQIAARLDTCARGARVLIVQGGVNDVAAGLPTASIAARLRAMVRRGRRLGLSVLLANVLPWNQGYPEYADPIDRLNAAIARIGRSERVRVLPFHRALQDPNRPGRMRTDLTIDGVHPSVTGYLRLGELVELP